MKNVLWISSYVPYDNVGHAGGKSHNFYLKSLYKENINIHLITICQERELPKIDLKQYGISHDLIVLKGNFFAKVVRKISSIYGKYNFFHKYAGKLLGHQERPLKRKIKKLAYTGYDPQVIILEWTETVLLEEYVKKFFPNSSIITIEEDVSYLSYYRLWKKETNSLKKAIFKKRYLKLKYIELEALRKADKILLTNKKDKALLLQENIDENIMEVIYPYFENMLDVPYKPTGTNIIFYGAMNRPENYLSVIWFIDNVLPLLRSIDITFDVIGSNPHSSLLKYNGEKNIRIHGFVENISEYFSEALCLAAPLVLGAGIKVKILEALSSGIPVLTNDIGIEGIDAEDKRDYFYCNAPEEYADVIKKLYNKELDGEKIASNAKHFIQKNFNLEDSCKKFINIVNGL